MSVIPLPYRWLLLAVFGAALVAFGYVKGITDEQIKAQAAEHARVAANQQALLGRLASNIEVAAQQKAGNEAITKGKDDEITRLTASVGAIGRLRHGEGICGRPAATAEAPSAAGSDGADPSGGLVREDVDRDFKALIIAVETDFATGRACQAFAQKNGFVP